MGDFGHSVSTAMAKSSAGCSKEATNEKKMNDKQKYKNCLASVCEAYVAKLTRDKHIPK